MRWLVSAFACAACGSAPSPAPLAGDIAIVDVSVVPMSVSGVIPHQTVIVRGDRIVTIAPTAITAVPTGATTIDGAGKWLMPGLADMHVHTWREEDLTMFVAAGVTTIRNMWGIPLHVAWRSEIERGVRFGPTLVTAGSLIDGEPPDWPGSVVLTNPADADALVVAQKAAGYDFLKVVNHLSREAYDALVAAARRHDMLLTGHVTNAVGLDGALAARQRSIEHFDGYLAALVPPGPPLPSPDDKAWTSTVLARLDLARLPALVDRTIGAGTWNCPTLVAYDRAPELYDAAAIQKKVTWLPLVPAATRARWIHRFTVQRPTGDDAATSRSNNAMLGKILAALADKGAPILVGTDCCGGFLVPGESLHDEIELMVAAGVPRARVLRAATADAWRYLGRPHEAGVIEVGARADLVLVDRDPLTSPLPLVPDGVMVRGHWLAHRDLETQLADLAVRAGAPSDPWKGSPGTHYTTTLAGTAVVQERVDGDDHHTLRGDIGDLAEHTEIAYELAATSAGLRWTTHTMTLALRAEITASTLVVTGTDLTGKPVSLRAPMPAHAYLSSPGIAGWMRLASQLADMTIGAKRRLTSVELGNDPIAIVSTRLDVDRKPDRDRHRVYAVSMTRNDATSKTELVVDDTGAVLGRTGDDDTITRRH